MKLEFSLLIVDDAPDNVEQAIRSLGDHLKAKGFSLEQEFAKDFSEQSIQELARSQGRNYDLVMVDYNLEQQNDRDGARVARQLRRELPFVDMVFYSSISVSQLLKHLAECEVSGVFAERREELDHALIGLANTVIGKAIDLNHMRGIAMAEVAEMDLLMAQTLTRIFQVKNIQIDKERDKTIRCLREGIKRNSKRLEKRLDEGGLSAVVNDSLLFSLASKYKAVIRLSRKLRKGFQEKLEIIKLYDKEIISNRNMLAHTREKPRDDGKTVLVPTGGNDCEEIFINEEWMSCFRQKLHTHRDALVIICKALNDQLSITKEINDTEERQS